MPKQRRIRIRGYEKHTNKPRTYQGWLKKNGDKDTILPEEEWDGAQPWSIKPMSAAQEDYFEALERLRPSLKGRQRQIVNLLFENETNQSKMARILGMDQRDIAVCLKVIARKILKISRKLGVKRPDK